jgi:hypothetical protein
MKGAQEGGLLLGIDITDPEEKLEERCLRRVPGNLRREPTIVSVLGKNGERRCVPLQQIRQPNKGR